MFAVVNLACMLAAQPDYGAIEREAMRQRIAEDRIRARFLRREEGSVLDGLAEIDQALSDGRQALLQLGDAAAALEVDVARSDAARIESRAELDQLRRRIAVRMAAMVRFRKSRLTDLLARARSMSVARRLRDGLRFAAQHDAALVRSAKAAKAAADRHASALRIQRTQLAANRAQTEAALAESEGLRLERAAFLEVVRTERKLTERLTAEIAAAEKKLDSQAGVVHGLIPPPPPRSGGFARQRGRLRWPVAGLVEATFGKQVDVLSNLVLVHSGIDIRAPFGEPVRAVFAGNVAESTWVPGFGNVVVLEHGQRWYSIYAHLDQAEVDSRDRVVRGEILGTLGESDSDKGPYLYFELRRRRTAVDPLVWLAP